jgi:ParB family chromosome partitioning protein
MTTRPPTVPADQLPAARLEPRELVLLSQALRALAEARSLDEIKLIRDKAAALRSYAKQRGVSLEIQNAAAEVTIRADRRMGELLRESVQHAGGRKRSHAVTVSLGDLGITKMQSHRCQTIASLPEDEFEHEIATTKRNGGELTSVAIYRRASTAARSDDWCTPLEYVESAREVLGTIDLDPATSEEAQEVVKATRTFTEEQDGLRQKWRGRVWLNPPYAQLHAFATKLLDEYAAGRVTAAIVLTHNNTDSSWFHALAGKLAAICFTRGRVKFINHAREETNHPQQGQCFMYFGNDVPGFITHFGGYGTVMVRPAQVERR